MSSSKSAKKMNRRPKRESRAATDIIAAGPAATLSGLFAERVARSPHKVAFHEFDAAAGQWKSFSWGDVAHEAARWQAAFREMELAAGERVALLHPNSRHWAAVDQAALGLNLVVVPLYVDDRASNLVYILRHTEARALVVQRHEQWRHIHEESDDSLPSIARVFVVDGGGEGEGDGRVRFAQHLPAGAGSITTHRGDPHSLASIVYTSGTTGRPKGVMLSHANILWNVHGSLQKIKIRTDDLFLSFLPLSHTFERSVGHYLPVMAGAEVAFNRSIEQLADDLREMRPTVLIAVPRIFERVQRKIAAQLDAGPRLRKIIFRLAVAVGWRKFLHRQGRGWWTPDALLWPLIGKPVARTIAAALGGRLRLAVCGGAPLAFHVSRTFLALGVDLCQGYGLTESAPVLSSNTPAANRPRSVGKPLGNVQLRIGEGEELLARGPNIMRGYWRDEAATRAAFTGGGGDRWLRTGDCARLDADGYVYITGRRKEILVLSTGEKIPPADMEAAIGEDPLFEQVMVVGEAKPFLAALAVVAEAAPAEVLLARIAARTRRFPGYARIRKVSASTEPWTVQNGLLTPTLKLKRANILQQFEAEVEEMYAGH